MKNPGLFLIYENEALHSFVLTPLREIISQPWPWYIAGPLIGLIVALALIVRNKDLGISLKLHYICATYLPTRLTYVGYDWKTKGMWNLYFLTGICIGGYMGGYVFTNPETGAAFTSLYQNILIPTLITLYHSILKLSA